MNCAKKIWCVFIWSLAFVAVIAMIPNSALATVTPSGDYTPFQPWDDDTVLMLGMVLGDGSIAIDGGSSLSIGSCIFGAGFMCKGSGTVTDNSTWNNTTTGLMIGVMGEGSLYIANGGTVTALGTTTVSSVTGLAKGTLRVDGATSLFSQNGDLIVYGNPMMSPSFVALSNGGAVSVANKIVLDMAALGGGVLRFEAGGGTLSTKSLYAGSSALTGAGTGYVNTRGWVGDENLIFDGQDANYGLNQSLLYTSSGRNVTVNLTMSDSNNVGDLGAGYRGTTSAMTIRNGIAVNSTSGHIAYHTGSAGTVTVTGANSIWTNSGPITVGGSGSGKMFIQSGGEVNSTIGYIGRSSGSSGTVSVDGNGGASAWNMSDSLTVGGLGTATLQITNGGHVENAECVIADTSGKTATVTVDGVNSTWVNNGKLFVGGDGTATLNILNGGHVTTTDATYAATISPTGTPNGTATINLNGGTLTTGGLVATPSQLTGAGTIYTKGLFSDVNLTFDGSASCTTTLGTAINTTVDLSAATGNGDLGIGYAGVSNVSLMVKNGAAIYSAFGCIGYGASTRGTATVDGAEWNVTDNLIVGSYGQGRLYIQNGSSVSNGGDAIIGNATNSGGLVQVDDGSTWDIGGKLDVGNLGGAWLTITSGTVSNFDMGTIAYQIGSQGTVTVDGASAAWISTAGIVVGQSDHGELHISNGGIVMTDGATKVAIESIEGAGSGEGSTLNFGTGGGTLTTRSLYAAPADLFGAGTIVTNGLVSCVDLTFDSMASLNQTLTGAGSFGTVAVNLDLSDSNKVGDLGVGYKGASSLLITNGVAINSVNGYLGEFDTSYTATVEDNAMWIVNNLLYAKSTGALEVRNGGMISAMTIYGSSNGTVSFDGGVLQAQANTISFMQNFGKAYVKAGGVTIDSNGNDISINQLLETDGVATGGLTKIGAGKVTLRGANTYAGTTTVDGGILELAPAAQAVVLAGAGADIKNGRMIFDYTGTAPDIATLLDDSYGTGGSMVPWTTGQFHSTTADPNHGLGWIDNGVDKVTVMYTLYGDSNLDGSVNGTDLNAVLSYYNQSSQVWACGDFNYDGSVNGTDLNTVLSNYNQSLSSSNAAVPEPSTLLLMVMGLTGLLAWKKRK